MERRQTKQTLHTSTQIPCSPTSQKAGQLSAIFTLSNLIRDGKKEKEKFALYPTPSIHPSALSSSFSIRQNQSQSVLP
jgi:hypothetical protein